MPGWEGEDCSKVRVRVRVWVSMKARIRTVGRTFW